MELLINGKPLEAYAPCGCGCGNRCNSTQAKFRPGHDAKLVSKLVAGVSNGELTLEQAYAHPGLAGTSLTSKLFNAITRAETIKTMKKGGATNRSAQKMAKASAETKTVRDIAPVKIGRWTYPARQDKHGNVFRNIKTDGSGEWVAA